MGGKDVAKPAAPLRRHRRGGQRGRPVEQAEAGRGGEAGRERGDASVVAGNVARQAASWGRRGRKFASALPRTGNRGALRPSSRSQKYDAPFNLVFLLGRIGSVTFEECVKCEICLCNDVACRNNISAIIKKVAIKLGKWMGLKIRNFIQVQAFLFKK